MTCPNCHAELGEGKRFCGKCGASIRATAAPHIGTISPQSRCPKCGGEVQPGKRFCGRCGSALTTESLQTQQQIPAAAAPTPLAPPPALSATVRVQPPTPPTEVKPCPHCGAPVLAGAKFCKQCGKSPSEAVPTIAPPPLEAGQPQHVPLPAAISGPTETAPPHPPMEAKKGNLVWIVAGLSVLVVLGAAVGYFKFHKRGHWMQANTERSSPASSANAVAAQAVSTGPATPSMASDEAQSASQAPQPSGTASQGSVPAPSVGESSSTPPGPAQTAPTPEPPPHTPAAPPYQQAHAKAEEAFAAERYIDPPGDCALSWARRASQQGDPEAAQILQQVLSTMARKVQAARAARNYDQSAALLTRLAVLFPDHPELQQLSFAAQQEQQEYARQLQRQRQQQQR